MFDVIQNGKLTQSSFENMINSKKTILYFYPKDNTPGCIKQAKDFTCMKEEFEKL
jgi:peroxiredoxin